MSLPGDERKHLCVRCESLDIAGVRSSTTPRLHLGPIKEWHPDTCAFCGFLVDLLKHEPDVDHLQGQPYFLFSIKPEFFSSSEEKKRIIGGKSPESEKENRKSEKKKLKLIEIEHMSEKLLQAFYKRLIVVSNSENGAPPGNVPYIAAYTGEQPPWLNYVQPSIDFSLAREWLEICTDLHADSCSGDGSSKVKNLRLIDCSTREVILANEHAVYVALSYVWGEAQNESTQVSPKYPKTIQDAIVVTKELGYQWLWVDKYCMDKKYPDDYRMQLQQMDIIYQQAVVTLVAASGPDPHYGLPGVGDFSRKRTVSTTVRDEHLCAIPKPALPRGEGKWMTRGWTYQEGLLSTRRLIFTDEQLYFECKGCYCAEMLNIPLEYFKKLHVPEKPTLRKRYRTNGRMGFFPLNGCGIDPWDMYNRISEYSERSLSRESDILNGILGIFRAFQRMENSMRHLYGIPFPEATSCPNETKTFGNKRALPTFSESLRWDLEKRSRRREGFPSWSWTGWYGKITWPSGYTDVDVLATSKTLDRPRDPKVNEKALQVSVELSSGTTLSWSDFQANYDALLSSNELSGFLKVEARTTPVSYIPGPMAYFLPGSVESDPPPIHVSRTTIHDLSSDDTFLAVHFHRTVKGNQGRENGIAIPPIITQHLLIVQDMQGHWGRVAIGSYRVDPEKALPSEWRCIRLG